MSHHSSCSDIEQIDKYEEVFEESGAPEPSKRTMPEMAEVPESYQMKKENPSLPLPEHPAASAPSGPGNNQEQFDLSLDPGTRVIETTLNMEDRDELKQNQGLRTHFFEVFAEPSEQQHSIACVWTNSFRTFEVTRIYVYKFLTLLLGLPIAFIMGFIFALVTFTQIWIVKPLLRLTRMLLHQFIQLWPMFLIYFVRPCFYSVGAVFSTLRFHHSKGDVIQEQWMPVEKP